MSLKVEQDGALTNPPMFNNFNELKKKCHIFTVNHFTLKSVVSLPEFSLGKAVCFQPDLEQRECERAHRKPKCRSGNFLSVRVLVLLMLPVTVLAMLPDTRMAATQAGLLGPGWLRSGKCLAHAFLASSTGARHPCWVFQRDTRG